MIRYFRYTRLIVLAVAAGTVVLIGCASPSKVDITPSPSAALPPNNTNPGFITLSAPVSTVTRSTLVLAPTIDQRLASSPAILTATPTASSSRVHAVRPTLSVVDYISVTFTSPYSRTREPLVDGERLFFIARLHDDPELPFGNSIFLHDLKIGVTSLVTTSVYGDAGNLCCMDVSQDWLTWLAYPDSGGGTDWRVFAKNLKTGQEILVDRSEDTGNVHLLRPPYVAISNGRLVWSSYRKQADGTIKSYVMLYDLTKGKKQILAEAAGENFGFVDIDGNRVVWSKGSTAGGVNRADVFLYDLSTSLQSQLTYDGQSGQPQIHGDWVGWQQGFNGVGPLVLYNLKTEERFDFPERFDSPAMGYYLQVGDGVMTWSSNQGPSKAYLYDIKRNILTGITPASSRFASPAHLVGRTIAMEEVNPDPQTGYQQIEVRTYLP